MPVSMIAWRANRAFGERNNAWRERVNKSAIAGRVASRTGIERSAAGEVVDAVFEVIAEGRPWSGATASRMKLGLDGEYRWGKYMHEYTIIFTVKFGMHTQHCVDKTVTLTLAW